MVTYRVLGSTEVVIGDLPIDLGGRLPRRLLTALLVAGGHPVPDDQLAETVWGDRAPADPGASLQVYVSRLRQRIRHAGLDVLRRAGNGYRLVLCPGAIDVDRFVDDLADGRALLGDGRPDEALHKLDEALEWWRGEAYADLNDSAAAQVARARLDELRETAVEERLATRLAVGDASGAVAELDAAVRATPYRERRWALLILGLYRCGRQADALASLRRIRALLADDLGVDPGPELFGRRH
jgi:DNA-binding SARP family transcriptional activator